MVESLFVDACRNGQAVRRSMLWGAVKRMLRGNRAQWPGRRTDSAGCHRAMVAAVLLLGVMWSAAASAEKGWFGTILGGQYLTPGPYPSASAACLKGYVDLASRVPGLAQFCPAYVTAPDGTSECNFGFADKGCVGIGEFTSGPFLEDCGSANAMNVKVKADGTGSGISCDPTDPDTASNAGKPDCPISNPCDPVTGNKFQTETDYTGPAAALSLVRHYNSLLARSGRRFGPNWTDTYHRALSVLPDSVRVERPTGRTLRFLKTGPGYAIVGSSGEKLEALTDASGAAVGWRLTDDDVNEIDEYDAPGRLLSTRTRAGLTQTLLYSDGSTPSSIAPQPGCSSA